ncbi:MAG: hypothetical protein HY735_04620 [Verrucomicrobia bacterium]|nr:hypothetical protein [Verrucomicrobiota bacterium]
MTQTPSETSTESDARLLSRDDWFTPGRFGIFLALAIVGSFPAVALGFHTWFYRDFGVLAYPMVFYHHESFWRGELPLWNPLSNCGAPFLAQWGTMALYPFSLIYLLLPLPWSLNFFCLVHLFWAGLGMYFLAVRWFGDRFAACLAGTAFVFNGVTFSCLIWPNYTVALGWMPWVILWVEAGWTAGGRRLLEAAVIAAMQMLAGVPEVVLLTWLVLLVVWTGSLRRRGVALWIHAGRVLAVVLLVCGLTAAQLWPFFDLLAHSQRSADFASSKWAMPATGWVNLFFPLFRCFLTPQGIFFQISQEFMTSTYLGMTALVFGLLALCLVRERRVWWLAGLAIFGLLMALGENGFLYQWFKQALPSLGFARYPIKFLLLTAFVVPLLAALGLQRIQSLAQADRKFCLRSLMWVSLAVLLAVGMAVAFCHRYRTEYDHLPAIRWCGIGRAIFLFASTGLIGLASGTRRPVARRWFEAGVLVLVVLDTLTHVPKQNPTLPSFTLAPGLWELHQKTPPPKLGEGRVMISPRAEQHLLLSRVSDLNGDWLGKRLALWSNLNLLEGCPKLGGSSTLQVREQMQVQSQLYASTNSQFPRLADFLAVTLVTAPGEIVEWARRETALPLVTGGQKPVFADAAETLRGLTNSHFNPGEIVYLPIEAKPFVSVTNRSVVKLRVARVAPHAIECEATAEQPSLIVFSQTFYPAWRAYLDGQSTLIWRANHAFQSVQVPPGNHRIKLVYEDHHFRWGAAASMGTLLWCTVFWFLRKDRRLPRSP